MWWSDLLSLAEAKLSVFWQLILDEKKQVFTSEKFLLMASEDGESLPAYLKLNLGPSLSGGSSQRTLPGLPVVLTSQLGKDLEQSDLINSSAFLRMNLFLWGLEGWGGGSEVGDLWRQSTNSCRAVTLSIITAGWVIGASQRFSYVQRQLRSSSEVWLALLPHWEIEKLLVSILAEKELWIFKCMFKILGCLRSICG